MTDGERLARLEESMEWLKKEMASVVEGLSNIATFMKSLAEVQVEHKNTGEALGRAFTEIHELKTEVKKLKDDAGARCKEYEKQLNPRIDSLADKIAEMAKKEPVNEVYFSGLRAFLYFAALVATNVITAIIIVYIKG